MRISAKALDAGTGRGGDVCQGGGPPHGAEHGRLFRLRLYGWIDLHAHGLKIPLGLERDIADKLLMASFVLIPMLIVPIISELPVSKVIRHLLRAILVLRSGGVLG